MGLAIPVMGLLIYLLVVQRRVEQAAHRFYPLLLRLRQASQGAEIRTRGLDTGHKLSAMKYDDGTDSWKILHWIAELQGIMTIRYREQPYSREYRML